MSMDDKACGAAPDPEVLEAQWRKEVARVAELEREMNALTEENWDLREACGRMERAEKVSDALASERDALRAQVDELKTALAAFTECPYLIDEASVPKAGIDTAPEQVVGTMSVSLPKLRTARALLGLVPDGRGKWEAPVRMQRSVHDDRTCGACDGPLETSRDAVCESCTPEADAHAIALSVAPVPNSPTVSDGSPSEPPCGNCGQDEETHPTFCNEDESKEAP